MPEKFCDENNKIAHSTLYKAVHGLGKSIIETNDQARKELKALLDEYLPATKESDSSWPLAKSLYEHTINRENAIRKTLFPDSQIITLTNLDKKGKITKKKII